MVSSRTGPSARESVNCARSGTSRSEFAGQLAIAAFSVVRMVIVLTGLQWTRAGRKVYR